MPGALRVVRALRQAGLRVGAVTNGEALQQQECLDKLGLTPLLHVVVISGAVGFSKPQPGIYHLALAQLGTPAAQTLFVGDSPANDIAAPQQLGLHAAYLPGGHPLPPQVQPNYILTQLADLLKVVGLER